LDPSVMPVGHAVTYEDPDIHMGHHRPLVMRQHPLNVEVRTGRHCVFLMLKSFEVFDAIWQVRKELYSDTLRRLREISI
jgi:hypothetical protein